MSYEKSTPESPEAQSSTPVQDNLKALADLFPSVVRDGQVDVDALRQLCGEAVVKNDELYGLNWRGKAEARHAALIPSLGTLRPCKAESKDWDTTKNLYIEGDNLEVLKLLRKSYGGKVKMIYIDPPYNTGKEFVYPDNYQNSIENYKRLTGQEGKYAVNAETSGRYHTDWLNMMYPRLMLARDLLSDDGVIFINIDDNEGDNLVEICSEVFGEQNFVSRIPWRKRTAKSDVPFGVSQDYEWVICYCKSSLFNVSIKGKSRKYYETPDFPNRAWRVHDLTKQTTASERSNSFFTITNPKTGEKYPANPNRTWAITEDTFQKYYSEDRIVFPGDYKFLNISKPMLRYWKDEDIKKAGDDFGRVAVSTKLPDSIGMSKDGTKEVTDLFNIKIFNFPKPSGLIHFFLNIINSSDAIILDFFSGSATTAHAVMQLNEEDGGNRRFIMVQLPEPCDEKSEAYKAGYKNICEIGKERIRRAGAKVKEEAGESGKDLDIGFRVYKLDSSNVRAWNPQASDLASAVNNYAEHLVGGRTEDDFLTEIMLKSGIDLVEDVTERVIAGHRVQSLGYGQYYACMAADLTTDAEEVALGIAAWHEEESANAGGEQEDICTVFVSDRAFGKEDAVKMNFVAILEQHGICNIKAL